MWTLLNNLSINKIKDRSGPCKLLAHLGEINDKQDTCEFFNNYFATIG